MTLAAIGIAGAFLILAAKRRRPQEAVAEVVAEEPVIIAAAPTDPTDESVIPRWRRPSLREARQRKATAPSGPAFQLTFQEGAVAADLERRRIRYRVVRLVDGPDEIRSQEVGQLEENDEVEVLGRYAGYVHVRTPVGTEGWVHRTTLGPPIGAEPEADELDPSFEDAPAPDIGFASNLETRRAARAELARRIEPTG